MQSLKQVFEALKVLESDNSRLFKEAKVKEFIKTVPDFQRVVEYALDYRLSFNVNKMPPKTDDDIGGIFTYLTWLSSKNGATNDEVQHLVNVCEDDETIEVVSRIVNKDLKCGVSVKTASKFLPHLSEFPTMLAMPFKEKNLKNITFPALAQLKADGVRVAVIVRGETVSFRSRNGKTFNIPNDEIRNDFLAMADGADVVFDGEMLFRNDDRSFMDRKIGNGIANKASKNTMSVAESKRIHIILWDLISLEDFESGSGQVVYSARWTMLKNSISNTVSDFFSAINTKTVENLDEAKVIFKEMLKDGEEGIILKNLKSYWENKRSKHLVKFKAILSADLRVIDWVEGTGKCSGMLGALLLESDDKKLQVSVGTGFTDEMRKSIGKDIIGKIVEVEYNEKITKKGKEVKSLFLPVYVCSRFDKDLTNREEDL